MAFADCKSISADAISHFVTTTHVLDAKQREALEKVGLRLSEVLKIEKKEQYDDEDEWDEEDDDEDEWDEEDDDDSDEEGENGD